MIAEQKENWCILWAERESDYPVLVAIATTMNTSIFYDIENNKHGIRLSQFDKYTKEGIYTDHNYNDDTAIKDEMRAKTFSDAEIYGDHSVGTAIKDERQPQVDE